MKVSTQPVINQRDLVKTVFSTRQDTETHLNETKQVQVELKIDTR